MSDVSALPAGRLRGFARWWQVTLGTLRVFIDPDTSPRCAAAAFFGLLSLFPAIATVALVYGLVADLSAVPDTVGALRYIVPDLVLHVATEQLKALVSQPPATLGLGLLISIPLTLWSSSRGVHALLFAMSRVRGEREKRGFFKALFYAVGLSVAGSIFVVITLLTVAGLPALIPFPSADELVVLGLRWPILLVISILILAALYRWGPDRHPRKFRYIWPGAILASLLLLLAGAVFSIYVENWGNFEVTFGSLSAAVVLLLWLYNSAQLLVLGAAFNTEIERSGAPAQAGTTP